MHMVRARKVETCDRHDERERGYAQNPHVNSIWINQSVFMFGSGWRWKRRWRLRRMNEEMWTNSTCEFHTRRNAFFLPFDRGAFGWSQYISHIGCHKTKHSRNPYAHGHTAREWIVFVVDGFFSVLLWFVRSFTHSVAFYRHRWVICIDATIGKST